MGKPKQLLQYEGQSLLKHAIQEAINSIADSVIIVLGANANKFEKEIGEKKAHIVENKEWEEGMASSVRAGLNSLLKLTRPQMQ